MKLSLGQTQIAPIILFLGRKSLNMEGERELHDGRAWENDRTSPAKQDHPLRARAIGRGELHMNHPDPPGKLLQSPFEEYWLPIDGGIVGKDEAINRDEARVRREPVASRRKCLCAHSNVGADATLEYPIDLPCWPGVCLSHFCHLSPLWQFGCNW